MVNGLRAEETKQGFDKRMQWFNDAKFGLFIHWGAYSTLKGVWKGKKMGGYAEWIQATANIPKEEYVPIARNFNPKDFDADEWIRIAKKAGMKYLVITSKHHEGFCLWDSAYTKYDIKDTAGVERDLLGELSAACKKHGVVFGTYYSTIDWHHPTQMPAPNQKGSWKKWGNCVLSGPDAKPEYITYMKNQLKELTERYDTQVFWFDGDWNSFWTMKDGLDVYAYLRELQPSAIINNRVAKRDKFKKDFGTPEQFTPGSKLDYYWEACWTINKSWGYKQHDKNWKSTDQLIKKLVDIVSKGGNLLLNVGPTPEGTFPPGCISRLEEMGNWLAINGDAVYGTSFSDLPLQPWGRTTRKDDTYYLHVFNWPKDGKLVLGGVTAKLKKAELWGSEKQEVEVKATKRSMSIVLPEAAPQKYVNVVELEFVKDSMSFHDSISGVDLMDDDVVLAASSAAIAGKGKLQLESHSSNLGWWHSLQNTATWAAEIPAGTYDVLLVYGVPHDGGICIVRSGDQTLKQPIEKTGNWHHYKTMTAGTMTFSEAGKQEVVVQGEKILNNGLFNLKGVILRARK